MRAAQPRAGACMRGSSSSSSSARQAGHALPRRPQRQLVAQCRAMSSPAAQKVSDLPASLQKIVGSFQMVPDPMARYKQLLFFAAKLPPMPAEQHAPENKVEGCVSQVWVVPELRGDGRVYWAADSDSQLTKGLAALLVLGLSGCTPAEILALRPGFIELLGLQQSLTPSRNNGFLNMFLKMQKLTLGLAAAASSNGGGSPGDA
ncbi:SufE-like protein [Scenedesmus sp. PABB004]|nr:SufE-like protein [Scenedesmus sp. PABB004]